MSPFPLGSWRALLVATLALFALLATVAPPPSVASPQTPKGSLHPDKIDGQLRHALSRASEHPAARIEAMVVLAADASGPAASSPRKVASRLKASARTSQDQVVDAIREGGDTVLNTFWLQNMVLARLRPETLRDLTRYDVVDRIIPNFRVWAQSTPSATPSATPAVARPVTATDGASTWGVEKIGADDIHGELGLTGAGVRIAVLDTGADISHPDLAGKMVTDDPTDPAYPGGWIEFSDDGEPVASTPHDTASHGTHVSGTALGGNASGTQIGVAPGARLMVAAALPGGNGTLAQIVAAMQWAMAPYDADGNPAGAPADVVNMSFGAEGHFAEFIEPTVTMYRAGLFPALAIGNNCAPGRSHGPGNVYEAASIGATDVDDNVGTFSCGEVIHTSEWEGAPPEWPDSYVVPDISAPGADVLSALPGGKYGSDSGTSMATPHVAGTVALMLEADPELTTDQAMETLASTAFFDDRYGAERPNTRFGWGRIDAYAAVTEVALTGGVTGTVTDADTDQPIAGATVTRVDNGRTTRTDDEGRFELRVPAGTYDLEVSQFGYAVGVLDDVAVGEDGFTEVSAQLAPLPRSKVIGKVTYGPTGSSVPGATVRLLDVPVRMTAVTDSSGRFTMPDVPDGEHRLAATAPGLPRSEPVEVHVSAADPAGPAQLVLPRRVRMSVGSNGAEGNDYSTDASITPDGRYVAFYSVATNLVGGDLNGNDCGMQRPCGHDVFVHDQQTGETTRVSVATDGTEGDLGSADPSISDDGRYVAFTSAASNLVAGDTNERLDVFVHDLRSGTTERVSTAGDGTEGNANSLSPSISDDGRYVAFASAASNLVAGDTNERQDIFVTDLRSGRTERVSTANGRAEADSDSSFPSISAHGRVVAFESSATNLVPGDTNRQDDVFVVDRLTRRTERVSVASDGTQPTRRASSAPTISADGRYVAFHSGAAELVPADTNARSDVFVRDLRTHRTERVSLAPDGGQGNDNSSAPSFSADGRYLVFTSGATNLVPGDTNAEDDVFLRDLRTGTTERVSVAADGTELLAGSGGGAISDDGRFVTFQSAAATVEVGDSNRQVDVFVHDRRPGQPTARMAVADLVIRPSAVREGDRVTVSAIVKNIGDRLATYDAVLRVDGAAEDTTRLILWPDRVATVRFVLRHLAPGTHDVSLGPLTAQVEVTAR